MEKQYDCNQEENISSRNNDINNSQLLEKLGYKVGAKIGFGSYSTVRIAYSNKQRKPVALKIIWKDRASDLFQTHFLPREIEIVKSLKHPNIVQHFQCIETSRRFIIVMEYASEGCLLDLMTNKHSLTENEARNYFRQLISALDFCHSKYIAHRDLKLENLLLFWENRLKVGDFGFSRFFDINDSATTFSVTFCGSNAYISPEILHQEAYNPMLADIWACGVILFAMVCGNLPFDDSESIQKLTKAVDRGIIFPNNITISVECQNLIRQLMSIESIRPNVKSIFQDPWVTFDDEQKLSV